MSAIPFGPESKDPTWRWGSFAMGVVGFILLFWVMTLFETLFLGWFRLFFLVVLALLLSARSGRRWLQGREPERTFTKTVHPTVNVDGKPGSTYVFLEPAKGGGRAAKVKPRDFGPLWWTLYTVVVRAPVALGDVMLTTFWRLLGGRWQAQSGTGAPSVTSEDFDYSAELPRTDRHF